MVGTNVSFWKGKTIRLWFRMCFESVCFLFVNIQGTGGSDVFASLYEFFYLIPGFYLIVQWLMLREEPINVQQRMIVTRMCKILETIEGWDFNQWLKQNTLILQITQNGQKNDQRKNQGNSPDKKSNTSNKSGKLIRSGKLTSRPPTGSRDDLLKQFQKHFPNAPIFQ